MFLQSGGDKHLSAWVQEGIKKNVHNPWLFKVQSPNQQHEDFTWYLTRCAEFRISLQTYCRRTDFIKILSNSYINYSFSSTGLNVSYVLFYKEQHYEITAKEVYRNCWSMVENKWGGLIQGRKSENLGKKRIVSRVRSLHR